MNTVKGVVIRCFLFVAGAGCLIPTGYAQADPGTPFRSPKIAPKQVATPFNLIFAQAIEKKGDSKKQAAN
jgi:hypothetical protein